MDKFNGIKRAKVTLKRNTYQDNRPSVFWRYFAAMLIVFAVGAAKFVGFDATPYFKQDYIEQYAET